ncbi:phycobilisome linker polypeptide [Romeria aff. gracilis LEGE 07310]|uniref:Phycobilisome linker polypeptide n=1 Tax=Vasconcelosia minhoensis LEGE 07310 TaxID=915328 RepID=A0A8J7AXR0_9CYAN|nr:phycobilisome linker polypeptide [Romeria gracilis]MBE9079473.1 phycobilisome linker polypeptide [Romeria aff. gracilis LEGE 07310]
MLGQAAMLGTQSSKNRIFVYEVTGLKQNSQTDLNSYPVRRSGSQFIQVPYSRMNEEMRRITALGGKIVKIRSIEEMSEMEMSQNGSAPDGPSDDNGSEG